MRLIPTLERFFQQQAPLARDDLVLVAFSGGADSTALLWGLSELAKGLRIRLHAVHLDHRLDSGSARRATQAAEIAGDLSVPFSLQRLALQLLHQPGESAEALARRRRYECLEEARRQLGARYIATGHQRDDQAETVLLRILFGSGVEGLAGIRPAQGRLVRPLLELSRSELEAAVGAAGLVAVQDPTNRDLQVPRNWIRHRLLPALAVEQPRISEDLARLARTALGAGETVAHRLRSRLQPVADREEVRVARRELELLAEPLWSFALALLHRLAEAPYPAGRNARSELRRQLDARGRIGCDCGGGWRWEDRGPLLVLRRLRPPIPQFTYTLKIPGELEIAELSLTLRLTRGKKAPWTAEEVPSDRTELALPIQGGEEVTIRNRREGDRIQPWGSRRIRRLKEVLIDRKIPRENRDQIPLLCVGQQIAWVPGVTVDERFRPRRDGNDWVAEIYGP